VDCFVATRKDEQKTNHHRLCEHHEWERVMRGNPGRDSVDCFASRSQRRRWGAIGKDG